MGKGTAIVTEVKSREMRVMMLTMLTGAVSVSFQVPLDYGQYSRYIGIEDGRECFLMY
jgi:hypothetical protein